MVARHLDPFRLREVGSWGDSIPFLARLVTASDQTFELIVRIRQKPTA